MTIQEMLDDRYGRTSARRTRTWIIVIAAIAVVLAAGFGWSIWSGNAKAVDVDDLGYEVLSASEVDVSFRVTSAHDDDIVCIVEALDEDFAVVGWQIVDLPGGGSVSQNHTTTVRTVDTATTGYVASCSLR